MVRGERDGRLLDDVLVVEVERFEVVVLGLAGGIRWVVEAGVAQGVGAFVPVEPVWPFAVLGELDGGVLGLVVGRNALHGLVVDQEVAAVVAGEADVLRVVADHDGNDLAAAGLVEVDTDHDRRLVPYPSAHGRPPRPGSAPAAAGQRSGGRPAVGSTPEPLSARVLRCAVSGISMTWWRRGRWSTPIRNCWPAGMR